MTTVLSSVVVPVTVVGGVPVTVVQIVGVITVRHGHVAAARAVLMFVTGMDRMLGLATLVHMVGMDTMDVTVVGVVGVVPVQEGDMATAFPVRVGVVSVGWVLSGHGHLTAPCLSGNDSPLRD